MTLLILPRKCAINNNAKRITTKFLVIHQSILQRKLRIK